MLDGRYYYIVTLDGRYYDIVMLGGRYYDIVMLGGRYYDIVMLDGRKYEVFLGMQQHDGIIFTKLGGSRSCSGLRCHRTQSNEGSCKVANTYLDVVRRLSILGCQRTDFQVGHEKKEIIAKKN